MSRNEDYFTGLVKNFCETQGWTVEVIASNQTIRPDLAYRDSKKNIILIEVKGETKNRAIQNERALSQGSLYQLYSNRVYVAMPASVILPQFLNVYKSSGIGLMIIKDDKIEIANEPKFNQNPNPILFEINRNKMSGDEVENREEKALESGPLERLFGGSAIARILDFIVVFREWDYSKMDISKNSGVSFRHVLREIPRLESLGIVKQTRRVGRAVMYQFNKDSPMGKAVKELVFKIGTLEAEKIAEEELAKEEAKPQEIKA